MTGSAHSSILGRLTAKPESKQVGEHLLVTASLAVNGKNPNGEERADFFDIQAWNKKGEILAMADKGEALLVRCRMQQDRFTQDVGGETVKRSKVKHSVVELNFVGGKKDGDD
jgi:single-stranded DNA-binding protein